MTILTVFLKKFKKNFFEDDMYMSILSLKYIPQKNVVMEMV